MRKVSKPIMTKSRSAMPRRTATLSEPKSALQVSCIQPLELLDGRYPETYTIRIVDDDCRVFELPEIHLYIWGKRKGRFEIYTLPTEEKSAEKLQLADV